MHKESMHKKTMLNAQRNRLNTQRKYIGCTKETNVIQIVPHHYVVVSQYCHEWLNRLSEVNIVIS